DLGGDAAGNDLEDLTAEVDEEFVHERDAARGRVTRGADGKVQRLIDQVLVVRLLGRLKDERGIGGRVPGLVFGDGFEVARIGHDGGVAFQRFQKIHDVTSSGFKVYRTSFAVVMATAWGFCGWSLWVMLAPLLVDQPEITPIPNQDRVRHAQKQPGTHHARNHADVRFQLRRIWNRANLAIENVVAVVRYKQIVSLKVGDRLEPELAQPPLPYSP